MVDACKTGASVRDLCILGDQRLMEETGKAFKKDKKITKGIAFPTCLSGMSLVDVISLNW